MQRRTHKSHLEQSWLLIWIWHNEMLCENRHGENLCTLDINTKLEVDSHMIKRYQKTVFDFLDPVIAYIFFS